jgi:DNA polymerase III subunit epsilon
MSWHNGPMIAFDTETTGTDPLDARIVSVCVAACEAGSIPQVSTWIVDPGVEIPAEAAAVHGITTEMARRDGAQPGEVLPLVADALVEAWRAGSPTIAMNACYDLTVLDAELDRHGLASLDERRGDTPLLVVDPLVIDRHLDRYRKGKKRLEDLCRVYRVALDNAHSADADALAAARVAWRLAQQFPDQLGDLIALQDSQLAWHLEWAEHFETFLRDNGEADAVIERDWPRRVVAVSR